MSLQLTITIRLLDDRFHGQTDRGRRPEWPPSPMRLFQALLAGAAPRWVTPEVESRERAALEWLQSQPTPLIITPPARRGPTLLTYVPNNNRGGSDEPFEKVRTPKRITPMVFGKDHCIEFIYPMNPADESAASRARIICHIARHIRCFGWGIDLAIGNGVVAPVDAAQTAATERLVHRPSRFLFTGGSPARVPTVGSLESLEAVHAGKMSRFSEAGTLTLSNLQPVFAEAVYSSAPVRSFVAFRFLDDDDEDVLYGIEHVKQLAGRLRRLLADVCRNAFGDTVTNGMILGHPQDSPRLSILPLPSIGHRHVDGKIRRVIFTEPIASNLNLCEHLRQALDQRPVDFAGDCPCPPCRLVPLPRTDPVLGRYVASSRSWASVTPVLLPGHNVRKKSGRVQSLHRATLLVARSLQQAGITTPAEFEINRLPYWPGTHAVGEYDPREKLAHAPRFHVKIHFKQVVVGPLAIGSGRHVGFGTLAALPDED